MKFDNNVVEKILSDVIFYTDELDRHTVYAKYSKPDSSVWLSNIESSDFRAFLRVEYREAAAEDTALPVDDVIERIHDENIHYNNHPKIKVHRRVAGNLFTGIEYFLADAEQNVVQVTPTGQVITTEHDYMFIKEASGLPQVMPDPSQRTIFELLQPFVNLQGDSFKLFVIWLIQEFSGGHHFCLFLSAERGSGKSLLTHVINKLLDPSPAEACRMPKTVDNLETYLSSHYLASFDNVDQIHKEYSDAFCVAVTGGTVPRRRKFKDQALIYLQLHNVLILNGIGIAPYESDLAERSLFFSMSKLKSNELRPEFELWAEFDKCRGQILWCVFDTLAKSMQYVESIKVKATQRMMDAHIEMLAIAAALGISADEFNEMLANNIAQMNKECAAVPLVQAIDECMLSHGKRKLEGTVSDVFSQVKLCYSGDKKALPPNAAEFGKKLNQLEAPLRAAGYRFLTDDTGSKANILTIIKSK